jgi:hypothetical protein
VRLPARAAIFPNSLLNLHGYIKLICIVRVALFDPPSFKFANGCATWTSSDVSWMTTAIFFTSLMSILRTSLKRRNSTRPKPEQLEDTCSQCHRLLDSVPSSSALDILWITDGMNHLSVSFLPRKSVIFNFVGFWCRIG